MKFKTKDNILLATYNYFDNQV